MKTKLLLLLFLPSIMMAQITQGFEDVTGVTFNPVNDFCEYYDADGTTIHTLVNYAASCGTIYVTEPGTATKIGYSIILDPTTANGPIGFTDTDFFGVGSSASFVSEIGFAPPEGTQAFFMEDVDGTITMNFDLVDLAGTTNPQFSMQYILEATSWEIADFLKITIQFTDCASSTITLIDTTTGTGDINDMGIEGSWNTLSADLTANIGCKAQLVVEFSSIASSEEFGLDDISFSAGVTLSNEPFYFGNSLSVFPNPSNGKITIGNSGVALDKVDLTDINGRIIMSYDLKETTLDNELDLSSLLSTGMYFMTIYSKYASTVKKIIIQK